MTRLSRLVFLVLLLACVGASASSYRGEQTHDLKALSAQEIDDYLQGKGMGMAKAAELNGYPGPLHVLELAAELELSDAQRRQTQKLFDDMKARAAALGRELIEEERTLDRLFASGTVTRRSLEDALERIAALQRKIRQAHLEAHLAQAEILSAPQRAKYAELRGYRDTGAHRHHGHHAPKH